jgi:formylglycine-generating enzyme required for sulfatase activity
MVRVPGGTYWMGAQRDDPAAPNYDPEADMATGAEHVVHRVTLSPFLIGKYEVTQAEWEAVMGSNPSHFQGQYALPGADPGRLPVDSVYRDELEVAGGFLERTGLRLPTEAEWECACRAGKEGPVPGDLDEMAWYDQKPADSSRPISFPGQPDPPPRGKTHPVGAKKPNGFGIHDMLGNVEEWVQDAWNTRFYEESAGSRDPISRGPRGTDGVFRGGGWSDGSGDCRCGKRDGWRTGESRVPSLGFRVCY